MEFYTQEQTTITVEFGKGFWGVMDGISAAIYNLQHKYQVDTTNLTIYLPELIRRYMELDAPVDTNPDGRFNNIQGINVVQGYDETCVIVAYNKGAYYNIQPIKIDVQLSKVEEDSN